MDAILISFFSLFVALLSLWLSYRNRVERIENELQGRYLEASNILNRSEFLYGHAETSFREFWRLSITYALLQSNDFDEIIDRLADAKKNINDQIEKLNSNKHCKKNISEIMVFALSCSKSGESFLASLKEDLRNLEKEVEHSSSLPEQERILKLRNVVTHIKQWEKF